MPSSSMRLTSAASEKRGGGSVKCCELSIACFVSTSPCDIAGRRRDLIVVRSFVLAFLIERQEAVELHDLAGRAQFDNAAAGFRRDVDRGALELGIFHLARDGAVPDQLVKPRLVAIDIFGDLRAACGAAPVGRTASCASCAFFDLF